MPFSPRCCKIESHANRSDPEPHLDAYYAALSNYAGLGVTHEQGIRSKIKLGYDLGNTIFEDTRRAVLCQNKQRVLEADGLLLHGHRDAK